MKVHCVDCNFEGSAVSKSSFSFIFFCVLTLCFIVPGLLYLLWNLTAGRKRCCPDCKGTKLVALAKWRSRAIAA